MEGTDQMLTYDSEWITFWDLKSNTEIGHFTLNNTPHGDWVTRLLNMQAISIH